MYISLDYNEHFVEPFCDYRHSNSYHAGPNRAKIRVSIFETAE